MKIKQNNSSLVAHMKLLKIKKYTLKGKGWKTLYHLTISQNFKKSDIVILISDKMDFML